MALKFSLKKQLALLRALPCFLKDEGWHRVLNVSCGWRKLVYCAGLLGCDTLFPQPRSKNSTQISERLGLLEPSGFGAILLSQRIVVTGGLIAWPDNAPCCRLVHLQWGMVASQEYKPRLPWRSLRSHSKGVQTLKDNFFCAHLIHSVTWPSVGAHFWIALVEFRTVSLFSWKITKLNKKRKKKETWYYWLICK